MARYSVLLEWDAEVGLWGVTFPAVPEVATQGVSVDEALEMARGALKLHLFGLQEDGEPLPVERDLPILAAVDIDLDRLGEDVTVVEVQPAGSLG